MRELKVFYRSLFAFLAVLVFFGIQLGTAAAQTMIVKSIVFPILAPKVSSKYGMRVHPIRRFSAKHNGVDLAAPAYSHVRAIAAGRVVFADRYAGYGKLVTIDHGGASVSMYGHLHEIRVNIGQGVAAGALIGRLGSTGMSTGPHLHFEWRQNNVAVDPLKVFPDLAKDAQG